jgi:hypothetical protein
VALVRRRLVRPDVERAPEDAFLFDHALIRDATYAAIAKSERARLHEELARWLDRRGEFDEIVGHHLEQASIYRRETGEEADFSWTRRQRSPVPALRGWAETTVPRFAC